jgi:hypothetical protein
LGHGGAAVAGSQITGVGSCDQSVVDERELVAEGFEPLPHRHRGGSIKVIKTAGFKHGKEFAEGVVEFVEDHIQLVALNALSIVVVPEFHASIIFEYVFDDKSFSMK